MCLPVYRSAELDLMIAKATVLEVGGGLKSEAIQIKASLKAKSSARLATASGETINT